MRVPGLTVFDVDDTLFLERDYVRSGFDAVDAHVRERCGVSTFGAVCWQLFLDGHRRDTFNRAADALGITVDIATLIGVYRRHQPRITLLPDAAWLLKTLLGHTSIAVVTDGPADSQLAKIAALELRQWTDTIVVTAQLPSGCSKPSPVAFEKVWSTAGADRLDACYVADNPAKDFIAPLALGWRAIRVRRPLGLHTTAPTPAEVEECEDLYAVGAMFGLAVNCNDERSSMRQPVSEG